jgi:hypothetical protein
MSCVMYTHAIYVYSRTCIVYSCHAFINDQWPMLAPQPYGHCPCRTHLPESALQPLPARSLWASPLKHGHTHTHTHTHKNTSGGLYVPGAKLRRRYKRNKCAGNEVHAHTHTHTHAHKYARICAHKKQCVGSRPRKPQAHTHAGPKRVQQNGRATAHHRLCDLTG